MRFFKNRLPFKPAHILIVDDEPPVRETVRRALVAVGHHVIEARDGVEGLAALEDAAQIDLIVTDLSMPLLGGAEMAARIRASRPDVKILYVTGFIDSLMDARSLWEDEAFLEKPFSITGMREAVSLLLYGRINSDLGRVTQRDARALW